jgi:DNA-binding beta-propeller fold protein YncE
MRIKPASLIAVLTLVFGFMSVSAISSRVSPKLPGASGYHVVKTIPIGGDGLWDYCIVDSATRRVYISHFTHVVVLNADTGEVVGDIPDTQGVHGIALAPALGLGFTSNGHANTVTVFDLKSLQTIRTVATRGENPDAIFYDAATKQVFAFNGQTKNVTAIEAESGKITAVFEVGGKPEFAAGDDNGHVFANIEDKSELVEIDAQKRMVMNHWPLSPCKEPSGLAMDKKNRRIFAVCDNNIMAVVDADSGKVVATPAIGDDPDAAGFDPKTQFAFSSNGGSGNLTVIHEDSPDHYSVVENVPTQKYARTMAIDFNTQNIFLPIADFEAITPQGAKRPPIKQGTFGVLLVSK